METADDEPTTMVYLKSPDLFNNDSDDSDIIGPSTSDHAVQEANADKEEADADKQKYENRIAAYAAHLKEADADKQKYENRIAAYAAQLEEANADMEMLKRRIAAFEAQLNTQPDNVLADIEELRQAVKCLTTEDRIVQMSFDDVFTNNLAVYSRNPDTLIGCQYADDKQKDTCPHKTMIVFGVRSLATALNLILSVNPPPPPSKSNV
uniref:Uncharacterized protein n=1 Tax=Glossina palpalis gambiensis TaxID=67801 RepID=A0A1B0BU85_9MUSC